MTRKKSPQTEGKEREERFDKWAKIIWPNYQTVDMKWKKPHAGFPDRMLYDEKEVICI